MALGLAFGLGGRDDPPGVEGFSHLVEHMVFKGTGSLSARELNVRAEGLGADLNGFTDKEQTTFVGRFPADQQTEVARLLGAIVAAPAFDPAELAKEKGVIAEEVRTTEEDPDARAANLGYRAVYGSHPMGAPVIGTLDALGALDAARARRLYAERYHTGAAVAVAVGEVDHEAIGAALATELAGRDGDGRPARGAPPVCAPQVLADPRRELSQVYLCLARPAFAYPDDRRYALAVLNGVVGGGLSSRLFGRLREDEGLVYSVSSFVELYGDTGLVGIFFVADARRLDRCVGVLAEELERLRQHRVTRAEFDRARVMARSALLLGLESPTTRMLRLARTKLLLGRPMTVEETLAGYERLTLPEVDRLIDELFVPAGWSAGAVGPLEPERVRAAVRPLA